MPRKNRKGGRGARRRSHILREIDKLKSKKKRKKSKSHPSDRKSQAAQSPSSKPLNASDPQKPAKDFRRGAHAKVSSKFHSKSQKNHPKGGATGKRPSHSAIVEGRLDIHPNGFAFVIPDKAEEPHVYIPQGDFREYMNRDKVQAKILRVIDDGKVTGSLLSLIRHQQQEFIGTLRLFAGGRWVIPFDARDRHLTFEVSGAPKDQELKNNQCVLCRILEYPTKSRGKVEIIQSVDDVEKAHNDTLRVLIQAAWPREFSPSAVREAENSAKHWVKSFGRELEDLSSLPFVTIDGSDARDFDDAIFARSQGGKTELWVAIADVSRFVSPGSRLDEEAFARSTSVYFPDHVVPMLPEVLSNGMCSLNPNEDRPALVCRMEVNSAGECDRYDFVEAKIRSRRRMTYEEMEDWIEQRSPLEYPANLSQSFAELLRLSKLFLQRRKRQGGLDLDIPEARVFLNKDGSVRDIQVRQRLFSHRLIEECMLAANRSAAHFLHQRGPSLFRVHEKPNEKKVQDLSGFLQLLGLNFSGTLEKTEDFAELLEVIKNNTSLEEPKKRAVHSQILRSMAQARYAAEALGHFALNEIDYTHFTSPIRRYPDLIVHRLIRAHLEKKKTLPSTEEISEWARHCSDCERQAIDMERKLIDIKKCRYVENSLGEVFKCIVTGVTEKGLFCQIQDHYVDGLLDSENLARRSYFFDGAMSYRGPHHKEITFGAEILLQIAKVDVLQGRINFVWGDESL